jgi:hypothetical protein
MMTAIPSLLSIPTSEKLTKTNYPLEGLLNGDDQPSAKQIIITNDDKTTTSTTNPAYVAWVTRDQAVLEYLLSSLTRETLMHVSRCTTATQVWTTLATLYSSQT